MKRAVFSSIQNFSQTLAQNPALFNIAAFSPLKELVNKLKADSKGCACNKKKLFMQYKGLFEASLSGLSSNDKEQIKSILKVDRVCYYIRNKSNGLELVCF